MSIASTVGAATSTPTGGRIVEVPTTPNVLEQIQSAIRSYPVDWLTIEIYDVVDPGPSINTGDDCEFKVRVSNGGPLHVDNLTLKIEGLNGVTVGLHPDGGPREDDITTDEFPRLTAGRPNDFVDAPEGHFHFLAGSAAGGVKDLVKVSVAGWNAASLDNMFEGQSGASPRASAVFSADVVSN